MMQNIVASPYKRDESEMGSTTVFNQSQFYQNNEQIVFPQCKKSKDHSRLEYIDKNLQPYCAQCISQIQQYSNEPTQQFYSLSQIILKTDLATKSKNSKYEFQNTIISESKIKMESILKGLQLIQQKLDSPKYNIGFAIQKFEQDCLQPNKQIRLIQSLVKQISQQASNDILEQSLQKLKQQIVIVSKDEVKLRKDDTELHRKEFALKIENYIQSLKESSLVLFKLVNLTENLSNIDPLMQETKLSYEEQKELEEEIKSEMEEIIQNYKDEQVKQIITDKDQEIVHLKNKLADFQNNQNELLEKFGRSQQCVFELSNELEKVSQILKITGEFNQVKKPQEIAKEQQMIEQSILIREENEKLRAEIDQINTSNEERINEMNDQIERLSTDLRQYQNVQLNYQNSQKEIEEQKYSYLIQENKYVEEITRLKNSVNQKEHDVKQLKQKNEELQTKILITEEKIQQIQMQYEESQNELNSKFESQNAKQDLKEINSKQIDRIKELEGIQKKKEEQRVELDNQIKDLNEKLNTQKQQMYKQQEQSRQFQEQARIYQEKNQEAVEENAKLKEIIKECKNQIQLDERNIYRLENEIKSLTNQLKQAYKLVNDQQLMQQSSRQSKIGFISMAGSRRDSNESKRGGGNSGKLHVISNNSKK